MNIACRGDRTIRKNTGGLIPRSVLRALPDLLYLHIKIPTKIMLSLTGQGDISGGPIGPLAACSFEKWDFWWLANHLIVGKSSRAKNCKLWIYALTPSIVIRAVYGTRIGLTASFLFQLPLFSSQAGLFSNIILYLHLFCLVGNLILFV
jgi:hypothetical protein